MASCSRFVTLDDRDWVVPKLGAARSARSGAADAKTQLVHHAQVVNARRDRLERTLSMEISRSSGGLFLRVYP